MNNVAPDPLLRPLPGLLLHDDVAPLPPRALNTTDELVSVTTQAWQARTDGPASIDVLDVNDAAPSVRDNFLAALDAGDAALVRRIAIHLTRCCNPLPGMVCITLGLDRGSTYGSAARLVLGVPGATIA